MDPALDEVAKAIAMIPASGAILIVPDEPLQLAIAARVRAARPEIAEKVWLIKRSAAADRSDFHLPVIEIGRSLSRPGRRALVSKLARL